MRCRQWRAADYGFLTLGDEDYPAQLREIHEMPPVLFHKGTLVPNEVGVSVVGSRQATNHGLDIETLHEPYDAMRCPVTGDACP